MELRVVRADPAGNITLFVLDPVAPAARPGAAARLMALPDLGAEQVAFVCPPRLGGDGRFEMAGGEFCGNAARAMGLLLARRRGLTGRARLMVEASGCAAPVAVDVDVPCGTARAAMPMPRGVREASAGGAEGVLVDLGGIAHFVTAHVPDEALLRAAEPLFLTLRGENGRGVEAYGVMFLHDSRLTPLVKVPAAGTLVWEGSCGSGALAAALAESLPTADGTFSRDYVQPAGTIRAEVTRRGGVPAEAYIGGGVTLGEPFCIGV